MHARCIDGNLLGAEGRRADDPSVKFGTYGDRSRSPALPVTAKVETAGGVFQVREDEPSRGWVGCRAAQDTVSPRDQHSAVPQTPWSSVQV
jgi:hypothetical protein